MIDVELIPDNPPQVIEVRIDVNSAQSAIDAAALAQDILEQIINSPNSGVTQEELGLALTELNNNINGVFNYAQEHAEDVNNPHQTDLNQILTTGFEAINKALKLKYNFGDQDVLELKPDALSMFDASGNIILSMHKNALLAKNNPNGSTKIGFEETLQTAEVIFRNLSGTPALLSDINSYYKGTYASLLALTTAHPSSSAGSYAIIDGGIGVEPIQYLWDANDNEWVAGSSSSATTTDALPEGVSNFYFTNARAISALASLLALKQDVITPTGNKRVYFDDLTGFGIGSTGSIFNGSGTLENESNIFVFRSGTGATWTRLAAEANRDGIIRGGTGSTLAGLCHIQFRSIWLGTGDFCAESFFRVQNLSDATNRFNVLLAVGLGTANTIRIVYSDNVNGGKLLCECTASSISSTVDSGINVAINTNYDLKIERISGVVRFYVNGAEVGTPISTNVPSNLEVNCTMLMEKTVGTTSRTCDFDYLKFTKL